MNDLVFRPAAELLRLLRAREISAVELTSAFIAQIERVNPRVNAIVTFLPEQAVDEARRMDNGVDPAKGRLAGLPIAFKDAVPTRGIRTTFGSPIYTDNVPGEDHAMVERVKAAGAITLGKTNTPEFAAGSQTFNAIFGATLNPYDVTKTCGGSSGGAAVAVACGMLPFADGSDLGASLRNPGNFCNVVGFRPTPGRVPSYPAADVWSTLSVMGPLARTVEDAALLLAAMAGPDIRSPISIAEPGETFARPLARDFKGARVAWWPMHGSRLAGNDNMEVDRRITAVLEKQKRIFESLGCIVEEDHPDLGGADEVFHVLRAVSFAERYGKLMQDHRDQMKDTVIWNIEAGLKLSGPQVGRAMALRSVIYTRMRKFMERYEFLVLPVNQVLPFAIEREYPAEINGQTQHNYLDWMKTCYYITVTSHPAIAVPAGFTNDTPPLPVGLQIVGRFRDDFGVLQMAHAFEQATRVSQRRPPVLAS
jgi:amidase